MSSSPHNHEFLGMPVVVRSEPMVRLLEMVKRVAQANVAVLISGESGSGKELVARAIHHYSDRAAKSWVDVSCATLPENLVESELFGHEKGAFSSADAAKPGLFELADGGTLFLDEIGELELRMQAKLLRILDGSSYYRLGGTRKIDANVRIITASNQDLGEMVRAGRFRADLYHRLSQIALEVPPLRRRPADVVPLAEFFLSSHMPRVELMPDAREALVRHTWPGNVREVRNVVIKAAVLSVDGRISARDLPAELLHTTGDDLAALAVSVSGTGMGDGLVNGNGHGEQPHGTDWTLEGMERRMIHQVLERTGGHQQRAADLLGISRRTLSRKLKTYAGESVSQFGVGGMG